MASTTESTEKKEVKQQPKNKEGWGKTFTYAGVAAACLAATGIFEWASRPAKIEEFGKVGEQFYDSFTDPTLAAGLEVFVFDREAVKAREFRVARNEKGQWVIPSHHDYPADAEDRLAQTATSVIGIERGALVTRWEADHGRYGVVNPKQEALNVEDVEGVGQRLILKKEDDSVLADYVIGKAVEDRENEYYVRRPEEDDVYIAKLDIDLSTKFTDWIDNKLFTFSNGDVMQLDVNDYAFDEVSGRMTETVVTKLSRAEAWGTDWKIDPPSPETEEINTDNVRDALTALSDLEVVGVRPKQKGLTPELRVDRNEIKSQQQVGMLQQDLMARGFLLQPGGEDGALSLLSKEGELVAGTNDGLQYRLYFGRVFTGSQAELEIGFSDGESSEEKSEGAEEKTPADGSTADPATAEDAASQKPGRYLFVRVGFDPNLLDGPKSDPLEPQKSARLVELEEAAANKSEEESGTEDKAADAGEGEAKADEGSTESTEVDADPDEAKEGEAKEDEPSEIEKLRTEYETAQTQFKNDKRDYEARLEKVKEGQEKADELNRRFAEWYYVIPGASFEKLAVDRASLVKPKEKEEVEGAEVVVPDAPPIEAQSPPTGVTSNAEATPSAINPTVDEPSEGPAAQEPTTTPAPEGSSPSEPDGATEVVTPPNTESPVDPSSTQAVEP